MKAAAEAAPEGIRILEGLSATGLRAIRYAKEILADTREEVEYDAVLEQVKAVGGANYGDGKGKE